MSVLEILLLLLGGLLPFIISSKRTTINKGLFFLVVIVSIAHFLIEGIRWQMVPIYLILFILTFCLWNNYSFFTGNWFRKIGSGVLLLFLLGIGFICSTALPIFDLPTPTGNYKVGSQYLHLITNEDEPITEDATDKRSLMIKVWYPSTITDEPLEPYLDKAEQIGFATKYGLPNSTFSYLDKVRTNTHLNSKIADGKFPILIFSHGYYSNATGYYALIEEIVSHGFIVLNINHTYESMGSLFPDGQLKLYDSAFDKKHNNEEMASMIWEAMENFKKASTPKEKHQAINHALKNYVAADITKRWAKDIDLLLKQLPEWEASTFLADHLDVTKIGVLGHSQGGAAAGQALLEQTQLLAGINIDGTQWGTMVDTFFSKPFMVLSSDWPDDHPNFNEIAYQNKSRSDFYNAKLKNAGHSNFMDIPFMINIPILNEAGSIAPQKAIQISSSLILQFFDTYLKGEKNNLLELSKRYPELEIEKRKIRNE